MTQKENRKRSFFVNFYRSFDIKSFCFLPALGNLQDANGDDEQQEQKASIPPAFGIFHFVQQKNISYNFPQTGRKMWNEQK